jgi:hypothetical protein
MRAEHRDGRPPEDVLGGGRRAGNGEEHHSKKTAGDAEFHEACVPRQVRFF